VGGILLIVLLATPGLGGHPGATDPVVVNVLADVIHVAGAAVWIGGLVALLVIAFGATRDLADEDRTRTLAPVVGRFSDVATVAIAAIVISGVYRSWVEVQALRGLTETSYGRVLLTKVIAFLPILALGAINNLIVKPRMLASDTAATSRLKRFVTIEVAIGAVVVALTALLVNIAPARTALGIEGPFIRDIAVGEDKLNVIVDPNEAGENIVHLTLMDPDGLPEKVRNMRVSFRLPVEDIGPLRPKARKLGPGHYAVQGRELSIAGEWRFQVEIMYDRFTLETVSFQVPVN
jgi:copper transport protein